jgi:hypothetical protein
MFMFSHAAQAAHFIPSHHAAESPSLQSIAADGAALLAEYGALEKQLAGLEALRGNLLAGLPSLTEQAIGGLADIRAQHVPHMMVAFAHH